MTTINNSQLIEYLRTSWGKQDPKDTVEEIAQGKSLPIQAFLIAGPQHRKDEQDEKGEDYRSALVKAGAIDRILEFLLKSDKPFEEVLPGAGDETLVQCPSMWLQAVSCACRDGFLEPPSLQKEVQFKVVNNIQGVFQDVSNFEERKFFGRKDSWIRSLLFFLALLRNLLTSENHQMAKFLMTITPIKLFLVRMLYIEMGGVSTEVLNEIQEFEATQNMQVIGFCQSYSVFTIRTLTEKMGAKAAAKQTKENEKNKDGKKGQFKHYTNALLGEFAGMPVGPGEELMLGPGILKL